MSAARAYGNRTKLVLVYPTGRRITQQHAQQATGMEQKLIVLTIAVERQRVKWNSRPMRRCFCRTAPGDWGRQASFPAAAARSKSFAVNPPASCVTNARRTLL